MDVTCDILSTGDARWYQLLEDIDCADVYFSPEYAQTFSVIEGGTSHLFLYEEGNNKFLYPFRCRPLADIEQFSEVGEWYDITSDYGYGGPIFFIPERTRREMFLYNAVHVFHDYCVEHRIVSEFCRFHPLVKNAEDLKEVYQLVFCNQTIWIDLTISEKEIWRQIRKGYRYDIRKAEKQGIDVEFCETQYGIDRFYNLYVHTMQEVGANQYYFFQKEFFRTTSELLGDHSMILFALYEGKTIAAAFYLWGKEWMHYYFAAMDRTYSHIGANKLLQYRAIMWGKDHELKKLHLGGGFGGSDTDSLMLFKSGFSKLRTDFYIAKRIHHHEMYRTLCATVNVDPERESFFPVYRAPFRK